MLAQVKAPQRRTPGAVCQTFVGRSAELASLYSHHTPSHHHSTVVPRAFCPVKEAGADRGSARTPRHGGVGPSAADGKAPNPHWMRDLPRHLPYLNVRIADSQVSWG